MEVRVKEKKWGNYSKGDVLEIPNESTALACIKAGAVESNEDKPAKETKLKTKK